MAQQRTQQAAEHDVNAFQVDEDDYTLPNDTEIEKQVSSLQGQFVAIVTTAPSHSQ